MTIATDLGEREVLHGCHGDQDSYGSEGVWPVALAVWYSVRALKEGGVLNPISYDCQWRIA